MDGFESDKEAVLRVPVRIRVRSRQAGSVFDFRRLTRWGTHFLLPLHYLQEEGAHWSMDLHVSRENFILQLRW
ncbi:unnamed protein product [Linum tenue]|uniref:Uncharacterized protein n=1 Tax=Linum tenue TaxID=586396 RepID=A0AAV0LMK2_9ROSI|nr:unnamed protein product [Linum tenue]